MENKEIIFSGIDFFVEQMYEIAIAERVYEGSRKPVKINFKSDPRKDCTWVYSCDFEPTTPIFKITKYGVERVMDAELCLKANSDIQGFIDEVHREMQNAYLIKLSGALNE